MGYVTVRPNANPLNINWQVSGGGGNLLTNVTDNTDSTYVFAQIYQGNIIYYTFTSPTIPAGAIIKSIQYKVRANNTAGWGFYLNLGHYNLTHGKLESIVVSTTATYYGAAHTRDPSGAPWTVARLAACATYLRPAQIDPVAYNFNVFELYQDVIYNEAPVVVVTAPSGTINYNSVPVTFTYTDPEGDPIARLRYKVFSAAQYGAGGFNPDTSAATWDSGEIGTSPGVTSYTPVSSNPMALPNGNYRAYVKAADAGSDLGEGYRYSAWSYSAFTVTMTPPVVPSPTPSVENY